MDEGSLGLKVLRKYFGELAGDIGQNVVWSKLKKWFKSWEMGAHLDDVLKGFLGFIFKIFGAFWKHVDGQKSGWNIGFSEIFGVVWGVSTNLSEGPSSSGFKVILWFTDESIFEWSNTFGNNNCHGKRVIESRNVTEGHDTWKSGVTFRFTDVINGSSSSSRVDNKLSKLGGLLGDFSNASSGILSYLNVHVLEAVENSWEDFSFDNNFGKIDGVFGDLGEALADVSLELSIWMGDEGSKVWDGTLIDNSLSKFLSVFGDLTKGGGRDSLKSQFWLLDAKDQKSNGSSINNSLSELMVVFGDARKSKGSSFLN